MNDVAATEVQRSAVTQDHESWQGRKYMAAPIVLIAALLVAAAAISRSFYDGRLADPITHNDVNYFVQGIQHLALQRSQGFLALASDFIHGSVHAPISSYQATLAYLLFGQ